MGIFSSRLLTSFLTVFVLILCIPSGVSAQQKGLEVNPAYSEVVLEKPEEEKRVEIKYTNFTDQPLTLHLSPMDFRQEEFGGDISFISKESLISGQSEDKGRNQTYSLSSFLSFETDNLELLPGESKTVKITIKNREDISPGGHYAAVVARFTSEDQDQTVNSVIPSLTSLILLRKTGGEIFNLQLQRGSWPGFPIVINYPFAIYIPFRNDGNIHMIPYGRVNITDQFGRLVKKAILNEDSKIILPESKRDILARLENVTFEFPVSLNVVTIQGNDSLKKMAYSDKFSYIYINVPFMLGVLVVTGIIIYLQKKYKFHIKFRNEKTN